jgi:chaperone required for assembly of F1-ATPase
MPIEDGYAINLDARVPRSPAGRPLILPTRALADLIAAEWAAQGELIVFASMRATRLAWAALDSVAGARDEARQSIVRYAGADLLCYLADAPPSLVARQQTVWSPLLAWARSEWGLEFALSHGIVHRPQPPRTLERVAAIAGETSDFALAGLAFAAALFGSAILALALWRGRLGGAEALAASRLDETFQEARWGRDAEAAAREAVLAADAVMLQQWFAAL